ncbi:cytoskeleton-associated protein 2-like [Periophthalmus magnuspinnatus]|uniref:cytoskeleton-associated protein 2-like n=1 Tax=Periophthalmus magnuspinnatus TaxID=409849 RepID=UPI002436AA7A|nr:cytoskeleton-associated protein 2-like [Periophthalmus magnuspinnatus]
MDTVPINKNEENVLTRKEIRRQKLMEFLAAKANLTLSSKKPNMGKDETLKSSSKVPNGKENKIPAPNNDVKVKTLQPTSVQKPLGLKNSTKTSSSNLYGKQNSKNISTTATKDAKGQYQIPVFTKIYTIVNSKSTSNAASQKQPFTRVPSVGKISSKTLSDSCAVKVSNITTALCTNAASATMNKTENGRMIHGPIIKTRTGLMPAVIQPRNSKPNILSTVADTKMSTYKARSKSLSHRPVSQPSITSLRKTISTVALRPVSEKTVTMATRGENKAQNKSRPSTATSKIVEKPRCNTLSDRLQSLSRCSTRSVNPDTKVQTTKTKSTVALKVDKNKPGLGKPPSTMTTNRDNFRVHRVATACNHGDKSKISKEIQTKKTSKPFHAPVAPKENKRPIVPQSAPQPSRARNLSSRPTSMKTPERSTPQPDTKPLTAAQDRIKKLQEWRAAKGISYKRPPMFVKSQARRTVAVPQPFWSHMGEEDKAHTLICAVDRSLEDCIKLLGEGCSTHQVKEVLSRLPVVSQKFAKYWICQVRLMEQEGDLDVLPVFEKAVGLVLEPIDELRTVVFEILKKRDDNQDKETEQTGDSLEALNPVTPKPSRALICAEKGNSSMVKYKITATPGGHPSQRRDSTVVNGQEVRFFTPVRRSVRIEKAAPRYPVSLQDHDLCVASYNDLIAEEERQIAQQGQSEGSPAVHNSPMYIYRENEALRDKVFVEYVCNDE